MNDSIAKENVFQQVWRKLLEFFKLVGQAAMEFSNDNALKFSASLSYYTLFSLAPMLIIVIAISSVWLGREAAEGYLYTQFEGLLGTVGALQLQEMIRNAHVSGSTPLATVIGVLTLIFGATGVFLEIQDSINSIWSLKAKPKRGWLKFLQNRLLSFSLIVGIGFLLLVSLVLSAMLSIVYEFLNRKFGEAAWLSWIITNVLNVATVMLLFSVVFKVLPDAKIKWRHVWVGALVTALLFETGKFGLMNPFYDIILPSSYDVIKRFETDFKYCFGYKLNEKWGILDSTGYVIFEPTFERLEHDFLSKKLKVSINGHSSLIEFPDQ